MNLESKYMITPLQRLETKIGRLFISPPESRSTAAIYLPKVTPLEKNSFGQLFMILEIDSEDAENKKIFGVLQEEIKSAYYGSHDFTIETALENALKAGNEKLKELISAGLKSWVEKFNVIVGVIKDREIHFTQVGHTNAFLIHQQRIVDILDRSAGPAAMVNPLKVFSNVISGTLSSDDAVLFCTTSLLDYLSQEKLRRIISSASPERAGRELQVLLEDGVMETPFAAIIIKLAYAAEEAHEPALARPTVPAVAKPDESMSQLISKEESTAEYLTPSIWPKLVKNTKAYALSAWYFFQNKILRTNKVKLKTVSAQEKPAIPTAKQYTQTRKFVPQKPESLGIKILRAVKNGATKLLLGIIVVLKKCFSIFSGKKRLHGNIRTIPHKTSRGAASWLIRLKEASLKQKILLLCAILLIFVFAYNIVNLGESKEEKAQKEQYVQNITRAKELTSQAESAMIYDNEEEARTLLSEAKSLLNQIPPEEKDLQTEKNNTLSLLQNSLDTVNHVEKITDPKLIADLTQTNSEIDVINTFLSHGSIIALDANKGLVIKTTLEDQETKVIELSGTFTGKISAATQRDENTFVVASQDSEFFKLDLAGNAISKISVQAENTDQVMKALGTYLSRLYVLDTKNNQIFRHELAGQGYAKGSAWLNQGIEVKDANFMTIDGSIFVAKNNGEILKFHAGDRADDFKVSALDPAFSNPTVIKATGATDNLYILDPNNKRLVIIKKDGKLNKQIYSERFDNLKDLALDEDSAKAYLLNGNSIYAVDI